MHLGVLWLLRRQVRAHKLVRLNSQLHAATVRAAAHNRWQELQEKLHEP